MRRSDSISAVILLSFSIAVCYQSSRYPFGTISKIGPGFMPFYMGIALAALSIIILLRTLLRPTEEGSASWNQMTGRKALRVLMVFFCTVAYAFVLKNLGFPITTFLFTLILFKFVESYGSVPSILGAMAASIGNYLIFTLWLQCQFPKGWLGI